MSTVNLKPFCAINDPRPYLNNLIPLKAGHCACDGFIFVASDSPVPEPSTTPIELGGFKPEEIAETARRGVASAEYLHPVSEVDYYTVPCGMCGGARVGKYSPCADCSGEGSFTHGEHEYNCKNCNGTGGVFSEDGSDDCPTCRGTGLARSPSSIHYAGVAGSRYGASSIYIALIAKCLPNAKITITGGEKNSLFGVFDGGVFMLMPIDISGRTGLPEPITLTKSGGVING